jgi:PPOX class probable F420-dependent enzyme
MSTTTLERVLPGSARRPAFASLRGRGFMQLTTFRKTGKPVPTTVWFGEDGGRLYVTTERSSGKVKRLRNTARVQVAPCTPWGAARGPAVQAIARVLPEAEHAHALAALRRKYGWQYTLFEWLSRSGEHTYLEVSPGPVALT